MPSYGLRTGAKAFEKSEDPIFVLENNIPINTQHYLDHQLAEPLKRLFEPILEHPERSLLEGEHTRSIAKPTPTTGGLMKFAKVTLTCLGCKSPLPNGLTSVCKSCAPKVRASASLHTPPETRRSLRTRKLTSAPIRLAHESVCAFVCRRLRSSPKSWRM